VKLLFDENVSYRLAEVLSDVYPESSHVRTVGLLGMEDRRVWEFARNQGFVIVSKDTDFRERAYVEGAPPKVVWLDIGNAGTKAVELLLRREYERVERFVESKESAVLILSLIQNAV
jgi:predicted nuclease of predicted toxin-antitoxin system